jgi:DNA replication ATP-dependent helicase Dna2
VGELLTDWRRMNVAMTRARSKFIMIGSAATLRVCACTSAQTHLYQSVPFLKDLLDYIDIHGWLIRLPSGLDWRLHSRLE